MSKSNYDKLGTAEEKNAAFALAKYLVQSPDSPDYQKSFSEVCERISGDAEQMAYAVEAIRGATSVSERIAEENAHAFFNPEPAAPVVEETPMTIVSEPKSMFQTIIDDVTEQTARDYFAHHIKEFTAKAAEDWATLEKQRWETDPAKRIR